MIGYNKDRSIIVNRQKIKKYVEDKNDKTKMLGSTNKRIEVHTTTEDYVQHSVYKWINIFLL